MALKDLFKMTKADRYTADGRDELIKAQEAETEDARQPKGIYHWKSGDYRKEGDKYVKIGPGTGGAGKTPQKQNPTRSYSFEVGSNGMPKPGTGKQVQTFKIKEEAQKALNTQNAVAKYKDLPGPQRKDALFASTFEGISIGQTQNQMERQGWDLIKADDQVNVYGKPDGSKVTMKHDGKTITETNYEAPESKPAEASDIPDFKGMTSEDFDKKLRSEGWTTGGWEGSETHSSAIFKKGDRTIRVNEGQPGKITSIQEISKPAADFTKYKRDTGLNLHGKNAQEGEQYMKENGFELQPESRPDRKIYKNGFGEKYEAAPTPVTSAPPPTEKPQKGEPSALPTSSAGGQCSH